MCLFQTFENSGFLLQMRYISTQLSTASLKVIHIFKTQQMSLYIYQKLFYINTIYICIQSSSSHFSILQYQSIPVQYYLVKYKISYKMHFLRLHATPLHKKGNYDAPPYSTHTQTYAYIYTIHTHNCDTVILNQHFKTLKKVLSFIQRFNHDIFKNVLG